MKNLLLLVLFLYQSYCYCRCGLFHYFDQDTFTCKQYPKEKNEKGYIEGCLYYSKEKQGFKCQQCKPQFMYEDGQCIDTGIPGCSSALKVDKKVQENSFFLSLKVYEYQCMICHHQYILIEQKCEEYPSKGDEYYIEGCLYYSEQGECYKCDSRYYYLYQNKLCKKIEKFIDNCISYDYNQECEECEQGYVYNENFKQQQQCIKIEDLIPNCEWISIMVEKSSLTKECYVCKPGYYVDQQHSCQTNPTTKEEGNIENCKKYYIDQDNKFQCIVCENDYYLTQDNSQCKQLDEISRVENCNAYFETNQGSQRCYNCPEDNFHKLNQQEEIILCKQCPSNPDEKKNLENTEESNKDHIIILPKKIN